MSPLAPRQLAHRGVVEAAGFVVDARLLGDEEARRRVLSLWMPGVRVRRLEHGYLVLLAAKLRTSCAAAPGTPLVAHEDLLLAAPLEPDELTALAPGCRSAVLVEAGLAQAVSIETLPEVDPADWIGLRRWTVAQAESLGPPPAAPQPAIAPAITEVREVLGGKIPPRSCEAEAMLVSLREEATKGASRAGGTGIGGLLAGWLRLASRWLGRSAGAAGGGRGGSAARRATLPGAQQARLGWLARAARWLESTAARLFVLAGPLARVLGRRHAAYLAKMMDLFQRGDLTEALRNAIPLGRGDAGRSGMALALPAPRNSLALSPYRAPAGLASPFSGPGLYQHLHALYRRAFERLRDAGRIDEAAFVLAELLDADEEAVSFLETQGKLTLAAQMAEARELAPGVVVRQWLVAGDAERALAIALRSGAFADACARLQRTHPDLAMTLRLHWGNSLAQAGDYSAAVDAVMPVPSARRLALEWADRGIEAGGVAGARLLARRLELEPEAFSKVRDRALKLCEDESAEQSRARAALGRGLLEGPRTEAVQALARLVSRALVRDQATHGGDSGLAMVVQRLAETSGDRALVTDLPTSRPAMVVPLASREPPLVLDVQAWDTGPSKVFTAAMLPGGQLLVALGEAGVRLVGRDGRTLAHFDQPASSLVMADSGLSALALAWRGEALRVAKLDLAARRAWHWRDVRLTAWACDFDGAVWWVSLGDKLSAWDVQSPKPRELWQVDRMGGRVGAIARSAHAVSALVAGPQVEVWSYELPALALRRRALIDSTSGWEMTWCGATALGSRARVESLESGAIQLVAGTRTRLVQEGRSVGFAGAALGEGLLACRFSAAHGCEVDVLDTCALQPRASLILRGAGGCAVRLQEPWCLVADDRGRLIAIDTERGEIVRDLRI